MEIIFVIAAVLIGYQAYRVFVRKPSDMVDEALHMHERLARGFYEKCSYCGARRPKGPGACPSCGSGD